MLDIPEVYHGDATEKQCRVNPSEQIQHKQICMESNKVKRSQNFVQQNLIFVVKEVWGGKIAFKTNVKVVRCCQQKQKTGSQG